LKREATITDDIIEGRNGGFAGVIIFNKLFSA
jgi:hypothetical protein